MIEKICRVHNFNFIYFKNLLWISI